ncbi:glycosyltransferase [Streptomyces sp. ID05-26A]|nr:glycosyltransferase [Streptomyces sp. ID05-26A]
MVSPVSVVIPCAPKAEFLEGTLLAVAAQTLQDWEVVLVLDGDCPENRAAAEVLPSGRVQILVTPAPRSGPAVGRNIGLDAAKHELVAFLDADDVCAPERLERQAVVMDADPGLGLLGAWMSKIDPDGHRVGEFHSVTGRDKVVRTMLLFNCLTTSTIMTRKSLALDVGGFDPRCVRLEDYELWLRILAKADGDVLPEELLGYRVHPGQYSRGGLLGPQTGLLRRSKQLVAQRIGVSGASVNARHLAWLGVQVANRRW